jgi:hypothetical protein
VRKCLRQVEAVPPEDAGRVTALHLLLAGQGLAPAIEAAFSNGLVTAHLPPPAGPELAQLAASPGLAHAVGALHRTLTASAGPLPEVSVFEQVAVWLQRGLAKEGPAPGGLPGIEQLAGELSHLEEGVAGAGPLEVILLSIHPSIHPSNRLSSAMVT